MSTNGTASIGALILALAFAAALSGASPAACQNRDSREGVIDLQEMIDFFSLLGRGHPEVEVMSLLKTNYPVRTTSLYGLLAGGDRDVGTRAPHG